MRYKTFKRTIGVLFILCAIATVQNCASVSRYPKSAPPKIDLSRKKILMTAPRIQYVGRSVYENVGGKRKKVKDVPFDSASKSYIESNGINALMSSVAKNFPNASNAPDSILQNLISKELGSDLRLEGQRYFHDYLYRIAKYYNGNPDEKIKFYEEEVKRVSSLLAKEKDPKKKKSYADSLRSEERILGQSKRDKNTLNSLIDGLNGAGHKGDYICLLHVTLFEKEPAQQGKPKAKDASIWYYITLVDTKTNTVFVSVNADEKRSNDGGPAITKELVEKSSNLVNYLSGNIDEEKKASGMDKLKGMMN